MKIFVRKKIHVCYCLYPLLSLSISCCIILITARYALDQVHAASELEDHVKLAQVEQLT
jgi:hypothetical protein